ncbi:juvenile hormone esterase-like [Culicoides brevitarsis]|uniref:juvenile hormone esterase-like n=1 Tax=Culicoides brevitarsis TaxID=469753 RepID=UPI00307B452D
MLRQIIILLFLVLLTNSLPQQSYERNRDLIVTLHHGGKVRGEEILLAPTSTKKLFSFKGIPYATPPVGKLRFKNPQPHPGWHGIRNATEHGNVCVQIPAFLRIDVVGSEDCLFLNVYTPPNINPNKKYPVMFWIHGGGFYGGSGDFDLYGPEMLVEQEVIVVTINYRLGLLGFFSTNDQAAQGNYGLKDCVEALKWVQKNIKAFGGDRNRVTIFGQSAGGAAVHYLVLSPMAKGLFHGAISQSGTALNSWGHQPFPRKQAFDAANTLNITFNSSKDLVEQFRAISDPKVFATIGISLENLQTLYLPLTFVPSVEPKDSKEPRFLSETPIKMLQKGKFNKVPIILGATDAEFLSEIHYHRLNPNLLKKYNDDPSFLIPYLWFIEPNSEAARDIIYNIRKTYFNNKTEITDILEFVEFNSDRAFQYSAYKTASLHAKKQKSPVFQYVFSFDGTLSWHKQQYLLTDYDGVCHSDDMGYMWTMAKLSCPPKGSPTEKVRQRVVKMWTDFSKYGHPTPKRTSLIPVKWQTVQFNHEYMDIGQELQPKIHPFGRRMTMWKEMDQKWNNNPY